jgi:transcriptional regulator with XRE-family HTH domain
MAKKNIVLLPKLARILEEFGENIKLARLRRNLSSEQVSERAGIGRSTLVKMEKGHPGVSIGNCLAVCKALGLENDFLLVAKDDELGRKLQDIGLKPRSRAPKKPKS